jgi:hypothetical protein
VPCGTGRQPDSALVGRRIGQAVDFVEREMPWEGLRAASTGAWQVRLESVRAEKDVHTFAAESFDAPPERDPARERGVHEGQHDDGDAYSGHLGEDAEGVGITGALRPFVDCVVSCRGDDNGVRNPRPGRARLAVLAADGIAGELLDGRLVKELQGSRGRDDLDAPTPVEGKLDQGADCRGRSCAADDNRQNTAGCPGGQDTAPICAAKWSMSGRMLAGAVVRRSRSRR